MKQILKSGMRWSFAVAIIGAAFTTAWWFTRDAGTAEPVAAAADPHAGMDMGATPATTPATAPSVTLSPEDARRIGVTFAVVERGSLDEEVRTVGTVTYDERRVKTVSPRYDGWVEQLDVAYTGQPVEVGMPLLSIYSPMLVTAQQELLLAKKLAADVGTTGDAAQNAEALVSAARRRLRYWDIPDADIARVEQTMEVTRTFVLGAPVRGVVVRIDVRAGQRVMAGDALYQIADLDRVWLEGEIFERDLPFVRLGDHVVAEFAALPGRPREGRISFLDPVLSGDTRTVRVRVELANPGLTLKPGMYATLRVHRAGPPVLQVPRSAVLSTGERTLVFVRDSTGTLIPRDVVTGKTTADRVEILRGVVAGETVVSSATFLIDAESNLSAALQSMIGMPGMSHEQPKR